MSPLGPVLGASSPECVEGESWTHRNGPMQCYERAPELRRTIFLSTTLQRVRRLAA
jgi:hypothetical protein